MSEGLHIDISPWLVYLGLQILAFLFAISRFLVSLRFLVNRIHILANFDFILIEAVYVILFELTLVFET